MQEHPKLSCLTVAFRTVRVVIESRSSLFGRQGFVGRASQSEAVTVAVGFSPREVAHKPCVAERRLKDRSPPRFRRRSATHIISTIIPWAQAQYVFSVGERTPSACWTRRPAASKLRAIERASGPAVLPRPPAPSGSA